jgi:hypothetical protein
MQHVGQSDKELEPYCPKFNYWQLLWCNISLSSVSGNLARPSHLTKKGYGVLIPGFANTL